jgi:hypothetical protein
MYARALSRVRIGNRARFSSTLARRPSPLLFLNLAIHRRPRWRISAGILGGFGYHFFAIPENPDRVFFHT